MITKILMAVFVIVFSIIPVSYGSTEGKNNNFNLKTWMTYYWDCIKYLLLKEIIMPGTHDSATGIMSKTNAQRSSDGLAPTVVPASAMVQWCKTQDLTIAKQLEIGVRFFDLRPSVEKNNVVYLSHGLLGEKLSDVLRDIANFCRENPRELIIIKVKGFPDQKCKKKNLNRILIQELYAPLKGLLVSSSDLRNSLPLSKFSDIVSGGRNIVVIFDARVKNKYTAKLMQAELRNNNWLFNGDDVLESPWGNTVSVPELFNYSIETANKVSDNKLYALHWTLTANPKYILSHLTNNDGIRYMTSKLDGGKDYNWNYHLESLLDQIPRTNIVQFDFITAEKARRLIELNCGPNALRLRKKFLPNSQPWIIKTQLIRNESEPNFHKWEIVPEVKSKKQADKHNNSKKN